MFACRIFTTDHYLVRPTPGLDPIYSAFQNQELQSVPVLRIFGATPSGQKTCVHVHGILPYFYVSLPHLEDTDMIDAAEVFGFAESLEMALQRADDRRNPGDRCIFHVEPVEAGYFHGFRADGVPFLKVFFLDPSLTKKAADLLQGGAVAGQSFPVFEAHIPYNLQFFIDYNLHGMDFVYAHSVKFRMDPSEGFPINETWLQCPPYFDVRTQLWNLDSIPREALSPAERSSRCALEVDICGVHILNAVQVKSIAGHNPGLVNLWKEETQRRKDMNLRMCPAELLFDEADRPHAVNATESQLRWEAEFSKVVEKNSMKPRPGGKFVRFSRDTSSATDPGSRKTSLIVDVQGPEGSTQPEGSTEEELSLTLEIDVSDMPSPAPGVAECPSFFMNTTQLPPATSFVPQSMPTPLITSQSTPRRCHESPSLLFSPSLPPLPEDDSLSLGPNSSPFHPTNASTQQLQRPLLRRISSLRGRLAATATSSPLPSHLDERSLFTVVSQSPHFPLPRAQPGHFLTTPSSAAISAVDEEALLYDTMAAMEHQAASTPTSQPPISIHQIFTSTSPRKMALTRRISMTAEEMEDRDAMLSLLVNKGPGDAEEEGQGDSNELSSFDVEEEDDEECEEDDVNDMAEDPFSVDTASEEEDVDDTEEFSQLPQIDGLNNSHDNEENGSSKPTASRRRLGMSARVVRGGNDSRGSLDLSCYSSEATLGAPDLSSSSLPLTLESSYHTARENLTINSSTVLTGHSTVHSQAGMRSKNTTSTLTPNFKRRRPNLSLKLHSSGNSQRLSHSRRKYLLRSGNGGVADCNSSVSLLEFTRESPLPPQTPSPETLLHKNGEISSFPSEEVTVLANGEAQDNEVRIDLTNSSEEEAPEEEEEEEEEAKEDNSDTIIVLGSSSEDEEKQCDASAEPVEVIDVSSASESETIEVIDVCASSPEPEELVEGSKSSPELEKVVDGSTPSPEPEKVISVFTPPEPEKVIDIFTPSPEPDQVIDVSTPSPAQPEEVIAVFTPSPEPAEEMEMSFIPSSEPAEVIVVPSTPSPDPVEEMETSFVPSQEPAELMVVPSTPPPEPAEEMDMSSIPSQEPAEVIVVPSTPPPEPAEPAEEPPATIVTISSGSSRPTSPLSPSSCGDEIQLVKVVSPPELPSQSAKRFKLWIPSENPPTFNEVLCSISSSSDAIENDPPPSKEISLAPSSSISSRSSSLPMNSSLPLNNPDLCWQLALSGAEFGVSDEFKGQNVREGVLDFLRETPSMERQVARPLSATEVSVLQSKNSTHCSEAFPQQTTTQLTGVSMTTEPSSKRISQCVTVMSMELLCRTRARYHANPQEDPIVYIGYAVYEDNHQPQPSDPYGIVSGLLCWRAPRRVAGGPSAGQDGNSLAGASSLMLSSGVEVSRCREFASEKDMLQAFVRIVHQYDPDLMLGHETTINSWGYLLARSRVLGLRIHAQLSRIYNESSKERIPVITPLDAEEQTISDIKIPGRVVLNFWRVLRHELTLNNYTFENVMFHVCHERTPFYVPSMLSNWIKDDNHRQRHLAVEYIMQRAVGNLRIMKKIQLLDRVSEFARVMGIEFYHVMSRGSQYRVESLMLRLAKSLNLVAISPSVRQRTCQRAPECIPLTMEPESRLYTDPLLVLDFQSLYPSIMIAYNYCFTTILGRVCNLNESQDFTLGCVTHKLLPGTLKALQGYLNFSPTGVAFVKPEIRSGVLPDMLREILNTRLMAKDSMKLCGNDDLFLRDLMDMRQLSLKLIANVTYGYTAASFSGRMPCVEIGDSIVEKGRETLERAVAFVHSEAEKVDCPWRGARVVYGDTDSLFVLLPGMSRAEAFRLGPMIAEAVTALNPKPIKLKFEKVYLPCLLEAKKRYVGFSYQSPDQEEPIFDAKGVETVRRDNCPVVSKLLEKTLKLLFVNQDRRVIHDFLQQEFAKIVKGHVSLQDFIIAKEYRGRNGYRPKACVPALHIAKWLSRRDPFAEPRKGERVPYVVVHGAPGAALIRCVRHPWQVLYDRSLRLDLNYYLQKQILPPLWRALGLVGWDPRVWFHTWSHGTANFIPVVGSTAPHPVHNQSMDTFGEENPLERSSAGPFAGQVRGRQRTLSQFLVHSQCLCCDTKLTFSGGGHGVPLCERCTYQSPDCTVVILMEQVREIQLSHSKVMTVCRACSGATNTPSVPCISLDCPVLYCRVATKNMLPHARHLTAVCDNLALI